jgi:leucyl aminopeptidase
MDIVVRSGAIETQPAGAIVVGLFEEEAPAGSAAAVDRALDGAIADLIAGGDLKGELGQAAVLYPRGVLPARRVIVVGLGKRDEFDLDAVRRAAGLAATRARDLGAADLASSIHGIDTGAIDLAARAQATVEGMLLGLYRYPAERRQEKEQKELASVVLVAADGEPEETVRQAAERGRAIAGSANLARTLVNHPSNIGTPTLLGETAEAIAAEFGLACEVHGLAWAREQEMGSFAAVAQGAGEPPRFIILEYDPNDAGAPTLVLVGKGITFDTGGISIKPSEGMHKMKGDMAGAAAVLGAMRAIGALRPPVRVIALVPATDNMPDAHAYKPGDVVRAMNGKTIEVHSTDAEGRMILADALCYASRYDPAAVVDLATLTGACVIALGEGMAAGCFTPDDALRDRLLAASGTTAERLWPMPLFKEYRDLLKSDVADVVHTAGRYGGVGASAIFLKEFTDYPWAHLDIAGMSFIDRKAPNAYTPKGATGYGVRLLVELVTGWR